jgi:cytochrome c peroxidase
MLYSWWTPPMNWVGKNSNAYESIRAAFRSELFLEPNYELASCMDTFFMKLKPVPSPHLVKGKLSEAAKRGRDLFLNHPTLDCRKCHPSPLYTDLKSHISGIEDPYDATPSWDTPSLIECWRTSPYGHLGSKLTVREMIDLFNIGEVKVNLTQDEINGLVEFVLSL